MNQISNHINDITLKHKGNGSQVSLREACKHPNPRFFDVTEWQRACQELILRLDTLTTNHHEQENKTLELLLEQFTKGLGQDEYSVEFIEGAWYVERINSGRWGSWDSPVLTEALTEALASLKQE